MGNLFDEIGNCYTCYDEGLIMVNEFITNFCNDCEKGSVLADEYAVWYAEYEMNEYAKENA
jgi:hypothetical protein